MKGTLGLKKGSVPFKNDVETTLCTYVHLCPMQIMYIGGFRGGACGACVAWAPP